mmetsp:Transcript_7404/g.15112  ORF Transcript_7404/g.15112 Transcript_7404/m.15112 type:complete len:101 (-) Transcript_7404:68-370(-)
MFLLVLPDLNLIMMLRMLTKGPKRIMSSSAPSTLISGSRTEIGQLGPIDYVSLDLHKDGPLLVSQSLNFPSHVAHPCSQVCLLFGSWHSWASTTLLRNQA